jgi:hypothetical protein
MLAGPFKQTRVGGGHQAVVSHLKRQSPREFTSLSDLIPLCKWTLKLPVLFAVFRIKYHFRQRMGAFLHHFSYLLGP